MQALSDFLARLSPPITPALVVRREALVRNLETMQRLCDAGKVALRAHGKMHKCSRIGRMQVERGAAGLCCQTVGEAEAFAAAGISDLLVTAPVPPGGAPRLAGLAATGIRVAAVADDEAQVDRLAAAAASAGTVLNVLVDIDLGQHRAGVAAGEAGPLARRIDAHETLRLDGVQAYLGHLQHVPDIAARRQANAAATARLAAIVDELRADGLAPARVTGGGTGTYAYDIAGGVFTELQAGSYALMDTEYEDCRAPDGEPWPFEPALFIAASVVSARHKTHATVDAGLKAVAVDGPPARIVSGAPAGSRWRSMGDEHGAIAHPATLERAMQARDPLTYDRAIAEIDADPAIPWPDDLPKSGALVWLQPGHCDPTINLYDAFYVADEDGTLERWPIDARRVSP